MHLPYFPQSPIHLDSLAILSLHFIKNLAHPMVPKILNKEEEEDGVEKEAERERRRGSRKRRKRRGKRGRTKTKRGTRKKRRRLQRRNRK